MLGLAFTAVFFVPAAAGLFLIALMLRGIAPGAGEAPAFLVVTCAVMAGLMLLAVQDKFIDAPADLQTRYLGRVYAGPLDLRSYRDGEWQYALSPEALAALRPRCNPHDASPGAGQCDLHYHLEDRSFAHVWIERDRLHVAGE